MKHLLSVLLVLSCSNAALVAQTKAVLQAANGGVTPTEVAYLDNVTSAIQTQLDAKLSAATAATTYQPLSATLTTLSSATAAGLALMDDADAAAQRTTLGLGAAALLGASDDGTGGTVLKYTAGGEVGGANFYTFGLTGYLQAGSLKLTGGTSGLINLTVPAVAGSNTINFKAVSGDVITTGNLTDITGISNAQLAGSIALSKLAITGTPDGSKFLRDDGSWQSAGSSGLTIGTTTITGGTSSRLLVSGSTVGELTPGSGVFTWLATNTKANLAAAVSDDDPAFLGGANIYTATGAASTSAAQYTGAPYSSGTATTNYPLLYLNDPAATAPTKWDLKGTILGISMDVVGSYPNYGHAIAVLADNTRIFTVDTEGAVGAKKGFFISEAGSVGPSHAFSFQSSARAIFYYNGTHVACGTSAGMYGSSASAWGWTDGTSYSGVPDTSMTRVSAGVVGLPGVRVGSTGSVISTLKRASATLVAGTVTVADTATTANSQIIVTVVTPGGVVGFLDVDLAAGVGYTINSTSAADTSSLIITAIHHP